MKVGIGYSNNPNSFESGKQIAQSATEKAGFGPPDFLMVFCNSSVNAEDLLRGVREIARDVPIIGGSAIGIITNDHLSTPYF